MAHGAACGKRFKRRILRCVRLHPAQNRRKFWLMTSLQFPLLLRSRLELVSQKMQKHSSFIGWIVRWTLDWWWQSQNFSNYKSSSTKSVVNSVISTKSNLAKIHETRKSCIMRTIVINHFVRGTLRGKWTVIVAIYSYIVPAIVLLTFNWPKHLNCAVQDPSIYKLLNRGLRN